MAPSKGKGWEPVDGLYQYIEQGTLISTRWAPHRRLAQRFPRFEVRGGTARRPPALRASTACRVGLVVCFLAVVLALPVFVLPVVLSELRVLAVVVFAAFALALAGAASRAASPAGASRCLVLVFTGCHVGRDPAALCLRNSLAASS
jgi:hypothetical protein